MWPACNRCSCVFEHISDCFHTQLKKKEKKGRKTDKLEAKESKEKKTDSEMVLIIIRNHKNQTILNVNLCPKLLSGFWKLIRLMDDWFAQTIFKMFFNISDQHRTGVEWNMYSERFMLILHKTFCRYY